jgi:hypothetical protein
MTLALHSLIVSASGPADGDMLGYGVPTPRGASRLGGATGARSGGGSAGAGLAGPGGRGRVARGAGGGAAFGATLPVALHRCRGGFSAADSPQGGGFVNITAAVGLLCSNLGCAPNHVFESHISIIV